MTMSFTSILRGRLAERIFVTLLERGGYRVTRMGIEELFDEIKYLPLPQYLALGLPPALRALPDLLVADSGVTWARLIEVKFRSRFDLRTAQGLHEDLAEQRKYWPDSHAVILIGEPFVTGGRFHQDCMRVVPPGGTDLLVRDPFARYGSDEGESARMKAIWDSLPMITTLFFRQTKDATAQEQEWHRQFWAAADHITRAIQDLARA